MNKDGKLALFTLLAAGLLLVALAGPSFCGRLQTFDDLSLLNMPCLFSYARGLQAGVSFTWCPDLFCGFNLGGETNIGAFHPLHLLLFRFLPFQVAWSINLLWTYPFAFLGTTLWLRRRLPLPAALYGGLCYGYGGFLLMHYHHGVVVAAAAHIPWLLWCLDLRLTSSTSRSSAWAGVGLALLTGSQLLYGHVQIIWMSLLAEASYAAFLCTVDRSARQRLPWAALDKGLGLLLGAPQLLSTLGYWPHSVRQEATEQFRNTLSVSPVRALQILSPYGFADRQGGGTGFNELALYAGSTPLLLTACSTACQPQSRALWRLRNAALVLGGLALLLTLGSRGYLYNVQAHLPVIRNFRCPARYGLLVQLAIALVASINLASLLGSAPGCDKRLQRLGLCLAITVVGSIAAAICLEFNRPRLADGLDALSSRWLLLAGPMVFLAAASLIWAAARNHSNVGTALVVFTAFDIGVYALLTPTHRESSTMAQIIAHVPPPESASAGRTLGADNRVLLSGMQSVEGYSGFAPARKLDYFDLTTWRVANVRFVKAKLAGRQLTIAPESLALWAEQHGVTPEQATDCLERSYRGMGRATYHPSGWLEFNNGMGRAWLVQHAVVSKEPAEDLPAIDVASAALVDEPVQLESGAPGSVEIVEDVAGRITMDVLAPTRQLLVVSEAFDGGWQAFLDSQPAVVRRVNGDFLGCVIPAGQHRVEFSFHDPFLRAGVWCAAVGMVLMTLLLAVSTRATAADPGEPAPSEAGRGAGTDGRATRPPRKPTDGTHRAKATGRGSAAGDRYR